MECCSCEFAVRNVKSPHIRGFGILVEARLLMSCKRTVATGKGVRVELFWGAITCGDRASEFRRNVP